MYCCHLTAAHVTSTAIEQNAYSNASKYIAIDYPDLRYPLKQRLLHCVASHTDNYQKFIYRENNWKIPTVTSKNVR